MKKFGETHLKEEELEKLFDGEINLIADIRWIESDENRKEVYDLGIKEILEESSKCLFILFKKLNQIPRNSIFWINNRDKSVVIIVYCYIHLLLKENPEDIIALYAMVGLHLVDAANDFGQKYWKHLFKLGFCNIKQIILAALFANFTANFTFDLIIKFIKETNSKDQSLEVLQLLEKSNSYDISCWATFIVNRI